MRRWVALAVVVALVGWLGHAEWAWRRVEAGWRVEMTGDPAFPAWLPREFHDPPRAARAAGKRIVVVGDGMTWGPRVAVHATFTAVAERGLSGIEVVNRGVPGYDARAVAKFVATRLPAADLLVYAFSADDIAETQLIHPDMGGSVRFVGSSPPPGVWVPPLLAHSALLRAWYGARVERAFAAGDPGFDERTGIAIEEVVERIITAAGSTPLRVLTLPPAALAEHEGEACNAALQIPRGCDWFVKQLTAAEVALSARGVPVWPALDALRAAGRVSAGSDDAVNWNVAGHAAVGQWLAPLLAESG